MTTPCNRLTPETINEILSYREYLIRYCAKHIKNEQDGEELAHDTIINVIKYYDKFKHECSLKTWIFKIANNVIRNKFKYYNAQKRSGGVAYIDDDSDSGISLRNKIIGSDANDIYDQIDNVQIRTSFVNRLHKHHKEILRLLFSGKSYKDIALILNINIGTVKSRIKRARDHLKTLARNKKS